MTDLSEWDIDDLLDLVEARLEDEEPGPETRATRVAVADARAWQAARRAVAASAGGRVQSGLGWEEV